MQSNSDEEKSNSLAVNVGTYAMLYYACIFTGNELFFSVAAVDSLL